MGGREGIERHDATAHAALWADVKYHVPTVFYAVFTIPRFVGCRR